MRDLQTFAATILLLAALPAFAQAPRMVADLATGEVDIDALYPEIFDGTLFNGQIFFSAVSPSTGRELWTTDGTANGTRPIADICPGPCDSTPYSFTVFDGRLYFLADDGVFGFELWSSDGTAAGTHLVADVCPGPCGGLTLGWVGASASTLFFSATEGRLGQGHWAYDGRRVRRIADICPGPCDQFSYSPPVAAGDAVFIRSTDAAGNHTLLYSDGTLEGTRMLAEGTLTEDGVVLGDRLVFPLAEPGRGIEPWVSDGTPEGTHRIADLCPGECSGWTTPALGTLDGRVYFGGQQDRDDLGVVWSSDGETAEILVADLEAFGPAAVVGNEVVGNELWLSASGSTDDGARCNGLWALGLGASMPGQSRQLLCGEAPLEIVAAEERVFLTLATELWTDDGAGGVVQDRRFEPYYNPVASALTPFGNGVLFNVRLRDSGTEAWVSDANGTRMLREIGRGPASGAPEQIAALGRSVVFLTGEETDEPGAWTSDGTAEGTRRLEGPSGPRSLTVLEGSRGATAYYASPFAGGLTGLWASDGTDAGTRQVADGLARVDEVAGHPGKFFFRATALGNDAGAEPWVSDGTAEGTYMLGDLWPGTSSFGPNEALSSDPADFTRVGGITFFTATDGDTGRELWRTNGRTTRRVADIRRGEPSSAPSELLAFGDVLLFSAETDAFGRELWTSDGTDAGTRRVADVRRGRLGSSPHGLVILESDTRPPTAFFFARRNARSESLWRTDGTAEGTLEIDRLGRGAFVSESLAVPVDASQGFPYNQRLFFVVSTPAQGSELWTSDGTAPGTYRLQALPGPRGHDPRHLVALGDGVLFAATDAAAGRELWASDGSRDGTRRIADLVPGAGSSAPMSITVAGPWIYLSADDGETGRELWVIERGAAE